MRVAEIYRSKQGEGELTGVDSVFIRASGCNLRCRYCDTPYASWSPEGADLSVADIVARVRHWELSHVVITGGEPMLFSELIPLCDQLSSAGHHITIETAGTLHLPVACDLMSISPKLANSTPDESAGAWVRRHEETRTAPRVLQRLMDEYTYQLKFVIDTPEDCVEVAAFLEQFSRHAADAVWLMPQGRTVDELARVSDWLEPYCMRHGYRFCPRRQIEWYGPVRGT